MENALSKLTIRGFKSIRELENFEFKKLNVFIGANGAGKSNLVSFFEMASKLADNNLDDYFQKNGGIEDFLYKGPEDATIMDFDILFGMQGCRFAVVPNLKDETILAVDEYFSEPEKSGLNMTISSSDCLKTEKSDEDSSRTVKETKNEARLVALAGLTTYANSAYQAIKSWKVYHFNDTRKDAPMRKREIIEDNETLRPNASNIAPFLLHLREKYNAEYQEIVNACRLVMPFLKDFILKVELLGKENEIRKVNLSWRTKYSDYPMQPYHLSDGSIRFICLATALLQPNPPYAMIFDEPELGLHPEAIRIIGELINSAAKRTQIIVATQSPLLIDQFEIEDIVVVTRKDSQSVFERLNKENFSKWLEDYSTGELWIKNVIQGGVNFE